MSSKHNSCSYRAERRATWYNEKDLPLSINLIFFFDTPLLFAASERDIFFWVLNKQSSRPIMRRLKKSLSAVFLVGFIFSSFCSFFNYKKHLPYLRQAELKNCHTTVAVIQYISGTPPFSDGGFCWHEGVFEAPSATSNRQWNYRKNQINCKVKVRIMVNSCRFCGIKKRLVCNLFFLFKKFWWVQNTIRVHIGRRE